MNALSPEPRTAAVAGTVLGLRVTSKIAGTLCSIGWRSV